MTMNGGKPHAVGDRGQRYEIHFVNDLNLDQVCGWASKLSSAASMCAGIILHPTWNSPRIFDRDERRWLSMKELEKLLTNKPA